VGKKADLVLPTLRNHSLQPQIEIATSLRSSQ
jgi:hypothetical protein